MDWEDELRKLMVKGWYINIDDARIFISSLLKKQREICAKLLEDGCEADGYHYCDYPDKKQTEILNAPEPE